MQDRYTSLYTPGYESIGRFSTDTRAQSILFLRPSDIYVPQTRKRTQHRNAIIRLAESIKRYGVLEPLQVRILQEKSGILAYELLENEQLWQAACLAGIEKVPCMLAQTTETNSPVEGILEQIRQKKLHIFDQATAFRLCMDEYGMTQGEIAQKLGISQSAVANKLRLLQFSNEERQDMLRFHLTERHARTLLRIKNEQDRKTVLREIHQKSLTVSAAEALVDEILSKSGEKAPLSPILTKESTHVSATAAAFSHVAQVSDVRPHKFALQSLQPLYNSIDRTLSIFRKTGRSAEMHRDESAEEIRITIRIPAKG